MDDKILFVDDDENLLSSYQRSFKGVFNVVTMTGGNAGIEAVKTQGPFAVVVSDFRMPGMDGVQFLSKVMEISPRSVRMLLTGFADLNTTVEAVNKGNIFRLLTKPYPPEQLSRVLKDGIAQYRLVTAEKELLEKTLSGSIKIITDVLSLASPKAFSHASRARHIALKISKILDIKNEWQLRIAAMLSQLGCVTIPEVTLDKVFSGKPLSGVETAMYQSYNKIGSDLIANIPRMDGIAKIIASQEMIYDDSGGSLRKESIPIESRILKLALDYDLLVMSGLEIGAAVIEMTKKKVRYDPAVFTAFESVMSDEKLCEIKTVKIEELTLGMVLAEDIYTKENVLLVQKGEEVTTSMKMRLDNFMRSVGIGDTVKVIVSRD